MKKIILLLLLFTFYSQVNSEVTRITSLIGTNAFETLRKDFKKLAPKTDIDQSSPYPKNIEQLSSSKKIIFIAHVYKRYCCDLDEWVEYKRNSEDNYYLFETQKDVEQIVTYKRGSPDREIKWYYVCKID